MMTSDSCPHFWNWLCGMNVLARVCVLWGGVPTCVFASMLMTADEAHASEISLVVWPLGNNEGCSDREEGLMLQSHSIQLSQSCSFASQSEWTMMTKGNLEVGLVSVSVVIMEMQDFDRKRLPLLHICRFSHSVCAVALRYWVSLWYWVALSLQNIYI